MVLQSCESVAAELYPELAVPLQRTLHRCDGGICGRIAMISKAVAALALNYTAAMFAYGFWFSLSLAALNAAIILAILAWDRWR